MSTGAVVEGKMFDDFDDCTYVGVYETHRDAEDAIRKLADEGEEIERFSIIARRFETREDVQGFYRPHLAALEGAGQGAWIGLVLGLAAGVACWLVPGTHSGVSYMTIFSATLLTATAIGALVRLAALLFSPARRALRYRRQIHAGGYIVVAHNPAPPADRLLAAADVWPPAIPRPADSTAGIQ